mgnify:CR=1 FL=1
MGKRGLHSFTNPATLEAFDDVSLWAILHRHQQYCAQHGLPLGDQPEEGIDRRKVAGVLAELKDGAVVLGIGLNVKQAPGDLPAGTKMRAGSLRSVTGRAYERVPILVDLLLELEQRYDAWRGGGLDAIYDDLGARDFLRGRRVTVDGVEGTAQMIGRDGRLEVSTASGPVLVESGEVLFER